MRISYWSSDVFSSDLLVSRVSAYRGLVRPHRPQPRLFEPCFRQRTRPIGRMERRCMPSFLNAHGFDPRAFGSRRTAWSFLGFPSPPGARGSQGEAVHSLAPDLPAARTRSEEHTSELQSLMRISY